jgi:cyclase
MDSFLDWPNGMVELARDVYAYVQPKGIAGYSNAGLIVGPEYCVVIDTLGTNSMQQGFVDAIRRVTQKPVGLVLITHHHVDHILGIQRFMPARIVCHRACRHEIATAGQATVERWGIKRPHFANDLGGIKVVVPDITFEDRISVHLGDRELVFFHPGVAHTHGDAAGLLPAEKILFMGDLFFNRICPAAFAGSLSGWIRVVKEILELDAETIVPGHGPLAGKSELRDMLRYLELIYAGSLEGFRLGLDPVKVADEMDIGEFRRWGDTHERLLEDVRRAYAEFSDTGIA